MQLSHKIKLVPNEVAKSYFCRACGVARQAYNWTIAKHQEYYKIGIKTSEFALVKEFNSIRQEQYPWTYEVTKWACQRGIQNAEAAFQRFFNKTAKYPKFKKKGKSKDSFYLGVNDFKILGKRIRIPKLGWVKMAQQVRFPGKLISVTISKDSVGDWYASVLVNVDETWHYPQSCKTQAAIGVDLGLSTFATLSTGEKISHPKWLRASEQKLKKMHRSLSRKQKGSHNRNKARILVAKQYRKIARKRNDFLHKLTSTLVGSYRIIGVEDLNVKGLARGFHRKSIGDSGFGEFRRQVTYKSLLAESKLVVADRFFPSSKMCSVCGCCAILTLDIRVWECAGCGAKHDRDINAAINLMNVAIRHMETENACGVDIRPPTVRKRRKVAAMVKQELEDCVD